MLRVIETVYIVSRFREKMSMPSLSAWYVQHARSHGESQDVDYPSRFVTIAFGRENRLILEQILGIEIRFPPLCALLWLSLHLLRG